MRAHTPLYEKTELVIDGLKSAKPVEFTNGYGLISADPNLNVGFCGNNNGGEYSIIAFRVRLLLNIASSVLSITVINLEVLRVAPNVFKFTSL
jgi:hypothetical protein